MGAPPPPRGGGTMADRFLATVLHLEQCLPPEQQTVESEPDVEKCTVLRYVLLAVFIYWVYLIRLSRCRESVSLQRGRHLRSGSRPWTLSSARMETEGDGTDGYELASEERAGTPTRVAEEGDSCAAAREPVEFGGAEWVPSPCVVSKREVGGETKDPRQEPVTTVCKPDAQRQQPTKNRHIYDAADAGGDMEAHERWASVLDAQVKERMLEEVNERYPFSLDDDDEEFRLGQLQTLHPTTAQSYLDWQNSTSQYGQDSWISYEDEAEGGDKMGGSEMAHRLLQNEGRDPFSPEFFSSQMYQRKWGTCTEDFSDNITAGQFEFYVNTLSHEQDSVEEDVPDFSPLNLLELDMSNSETFRPYPFLETILEETAEDLQGESSGSESGSCSRRSSSSSFWNDDSESGSVIYLPGGKAESDYGVSASVEADLDACLAALDAEDQEAEEEQAAVAERTQLNRTFSVPESNSCSQNDNDKVLSESSDEDDGSGRVLAEADLTVPQGNGESRSPSVTDSLIQFEALEKELDDDVGDEDPFASLDEQNLEFHTSATSQPFEDSFLVQIVGAGIRDQETEEDCLSHSSTHTMVPDESPNWKPNSQRPWTSLAHLGNGKVKQEESPPLPGDSQPRSWRSEGNLPGTHDQDDLRGLLKVRYDQSHYSSVGTSCWEYEQEPLEHESHFVGHEEGQDEEVQWLDLVHSAKMEQPWTLRAREDLQPDAEPELWSPNQHSLQSFSSEERDPGLTSSEESESGEDYSDVEPFESNLSFRSLRSALHMRSYCSFDSLHLVGNEARNSLLGASLLSRPLESVDEDILPQEDEELGLPEADEAELHEDQSQSSSESLGSHPSGDFENTKRKLSYQNSSEALSEDSGYGDAGGRHITPPPMLDPSTVLSSGEALVTSTPRRPRPLSLEEAEIFLTSENLHSPADVTRGEAERAEESEGEDGEEIGEAERAARSGPHLHSYAMSPPTPPLWLTAWAQAADGEAGENAKLMGTREDEAEEAQRSEEEEDGEGNAGEGEVGMVGLPDAKIGPGTEDQMPSHPQLSASSYAEPAVTVVTVVTTLPAHELRQDCPPTAINLCHYPSRESVVKTNLSPSPSLIDEDELNPLGDTAEDGERDTMGTPTRVALKRYGPRSDVQVYLSKEAKLDLEEEAQRSTLSGHSHKGVHFSPVVSAVNWRESYLEEPEEDDEEPGLGVQKVTVIEEEVKPLNIQTVVIQTARPASPPAAEAPEPPLKKGASLEDMDVISSKDINPPGKQEFSVMNAPSEKCKKDKEPLFARFSLARLSARMSATFHKAATPTPTPDSSLDKENASSKKSKKDKKREKEWKKAEAEKLKKKPDVPPKPKHLLLSKRASKHDSPSPQVIADGGAKPVIKTAATSTEEADNAGLNIGEEDEHAPPLHPGNDVPSGNGPEVQPPHLPSSTSTALTPSSDSDQLSESRYESGEQQASAEDLEEREETISPAPKPPIPLPRGLGKPPLPPQTKPRTLYARKAYLDVNKGNQTLPANTKELTLDAALEQFTNSARQDRERLARSVPDLALVEQMSREGGPHYYRVSQVVPIDRTTAETESTPTPKPRSSSSNSMSAVDYATGSSPSSPGGQEGSAYHNGPNYAVPGYEALEQARHKAREAALSRASSVETAWNATLSRTSLSQQLNGIRPEGAEAVEGFANRCRAQSLGPSGLLETSFDIRTGSKGNPTEPRYREGEVECEEWRETNLDDIIRDLEHLSHSYFYVNRDPASPKAAPSLHHRRSVVGAGKARSMYNLGVADTSISPAQSNHSSNCATDQDPVNMERAAAMMTSAGSGGNRGQEWDSSRAKSMEFLLDADNKQRIQPPENQLQKLGDTRQMSEHELRIQRSLQRLNVPDWYKKYASNTPHQNDELDATTSTPSTGILRRRDFGSGTFSPGASTRSTGGWSNFQRDSKTASMTSLGSRSTTPTRVVIPTRVRAPDWRYVKSSRESLASPASTMSSNVVSPSPSQETSQMNSTLFSWNNGPAVGTQPSRWSSTRMSVSSGTASPGSASTYRSSLLTSRTPYLGWRSQEKLNATESHTSYQSPSERLAHSVRTSSNSALSATGSSPATRSPSRQPPEPEPASEDVRTSIREVTSAIVHYVTESTSPQPNGHASQPPFDKTTLQHLASSRSPSPRRQRCVWVESSFLGTPPPVARTLASPASSSTPSPLPSYGTGRRTTDSAIDYGRAVMFRETRPVLVEPVACKEVKPSTVTSPTMEDVINSLLGLPSPQCALRRPTSQPVFNRTCNPTNGCDSLRNEKSCSDLRSASGTSGMFQSS